ncbi:MAG TPA: ankyrin repeat domain-containing protein, partial [Blastocatellia bacterium]|nr:ankyrin repeat domain-containing protein [Blastocatellia bacterium]
FVRSETASMLNGSASAAKALLDPAPASPLIAGGSDHQRWGGVALIALALLSACSHKPLTRDEMLARLARHGLEYSPESFVKAAQTVGPDLLELYLDAGMDPNVRNPSGTTALMNAAAFDRTDSLRLLLDHGADLSLRNQNGYTALLYGANGYASDCVRVLLDHGANVNDITPNRDTALILCIPVGPVSRIPLVDVDTRQKFLSCYRVFLDRGADVNAASREGYTALMRAAQGGNPDIVSALLSRGADVRKVDQRGKTALDYAIESGYQDVANVLGAAGAKQVSR